METQRVPADTRKKLSTTLWATLAVLTCPCHLPIFAAGLAGTTAGAYIGNHWFIAAGALTGLFVLAVLRLGTSFSERE